MKFQVLSGKHSDAAGKTYVKGEVVESSRPLDEVFLNKFRRLEEAPKAAAPAASSQKDK